LKSDLQLLTFSLIGIMSQIKKKSFGKLLGSTVDPENEKKEQHGVQCTEDGGSRVQLSNSSTRQLEVQGHFPVESCGGIDLSDEAANRIVMEAAGIRSSRVVYTINMEEGIIGAFQSSRNASEPNHG
jgi:hypothetical protein